MEALCDELRLHYAAGFPVNVWKLAEGLDIRVMESKWRGFPHAICLYPVRVVILNGRRPLCARRFDLAHEISHFLWGVERWHTDRANRFAAELLMPARQFRLEVLSGGLHDGLLDVFGVSRQSAELRAKELGWRGNGLG